MLVVKYEYIGTTGTVWHDGTEDMLLHYKTRFLSETEPQS